MIKYSFWNAPLKYCTGTLFVLAVIMSSPSDTVAKPVLDKPIMDPVSKSYFELVEDQTISTQGPVWSQAVELAQTHYHNGIQGRLAVIKSPQTELFIRTELRPDEHAWFGLSYDCASRKLVWVTGEDLRQGQYANWDPIKWNRAHAGLFCPAGTSHMPAFITAGDQTKYWAVQLHGKRYYQYIVEYPANGKKGAPEKAKAAPAPEGQSSKAPDAATTATSATGAGTEVREDTTAPVDQTGSEAPDNDQKYTHDGRNEE